MMANADCLCFLIQQQHYQSMDQEELKLYACCPFDKNHIVESSKLLKHIQKCKSPNKANFQPCPYNPLHWTTSRRIDGHKLECPDRNKYSGSFQFEPQSRTHSKKAKGKMENSLISEIPHNQALDQSSQIYQLGLDFQKHKPPKNEIERIPKKKINKREMKELNRQRLWQEPNFAEWFDANYESQVNRDRHSQRNQRQPHFLIQDDF